MLSARPEIPPRLINALRGFPLGEAKPRIRAEMIIDRPNITQQIVSMAYVTGEVCGIQRPRDLLAAANENLMLAPHWWHFVAVAPTSVPQAGQSCGRICFGSDRNIPASWLRQRSTL